ncbi:MAG: hypothetical protein KDC91_07150 [Flavobacteriaceae bacterium]|nr:hypothetical protein [Flavobacteriaceae bacterium]
MKKSLAILLLFLFLFKLGGYLLLHNFQQAQIRREIKTAIKQGVPDNELTLIEVSGKNSELLTWKDKHEFWYQGALYDVVKIEETSKGTVKYHCINDTKETLLFANLDDLVKKSMDGKSKQQLSWQFSIPFFFENVEDLLPGSDIEILQRKAEIFGYHFRLSTPYLTLESPPPQLS